MAAPSYTTDLQTLNLSTGTWDEFDGAASGSAPTENDSDNFIAGTDSTTEAVRNSGLSSMYAPANTQTVASGDAVFMWCYFAAMPNMKTYANAGYSAAMGSGAGDYKKWTIQGSDTLPYGGWFSVAVDPAQAATATVGSPSGVLTYFGSVIDLTSGIAKGNAFANDYQRYGRSLIVTEGDGTNGYGTFAGAAAVNDAVTARWGLFAEVAGGYSQKGLFQMGSAATAVDFRDSNVSITVEDTPHCAAAFNEFEVLNTGSNIEWVGVSITGLGTQSPGKFTVTDNAPVVHDQCTFTDMGAFVYQSLSNLDDTVYRRTGQVTQDGADFAGCLFDSSTAAISLVVDDISKVLKNGFISDGSNHAVDLGTFSADETITWDNELSGYAASDGSTGNEAIKVSVDTGITLTISVAATGTRPYVYNTGLGTVTVVTGQITVQVTVYDDSTGLPLQYARVQLNEDSDNSEVISAETNASGVVSTTISYTADTPVHGWARQWDLSGDDYTPKNISGTIGSGGLSIDVRLTPI